MSTGFKIIYSTHQFLFNVCRKDRSLLPIREWPTARGGWSLQLVLYSCLWPWLKCGQTDKRQNWCGQAVKIVKLVQSTAVKVLFEQSDSTFWPWLQICEYGTNWSDHPLYSFKLGDIPSNACWKDRISLLIRELVTHSTSFRLARGRRYMYLPKSSR